MVSPEKLLAKLLSLSPRWVMASVPELAKGKASLLKRVKSKVVEVEAVVSL
jgi:hypothetical protein